MNIYTIYMDIYINKIRQSYIDKRLKIQLVNGWQYVTSELQYGMPTMQCFAKQNKSNKLNIKNT